jgi:DNA invertase Pin-like site-specific DNA recombinase
MRHLPRLIGYARVSTEDQDLRSQVDELKAAGCSVVHQEKRSGADRERPVLAGIVDKAQAGDVLVVVRIDRLARSVSHLLTVIETLEEKGAYFRSLRDPIDTTTPQGMFSLQVLGAVAQLERALIADRTKAGLKTAKAQGRVGGNPGLRAGDKAAISKLGTARAQARLSRLIGQMETFMPTVRAMRPRRPWPAVVQTLNALGRGRWTVERLCRCVRRLAAEGLVDKAVLGRARPATPRARHSAELAGIVKGIRLAHPEKSLRELAALLETMDLKTPRGLAKWHPDSVANLLG